MFTVRVVRHWNRLLSEVVDALVLSEFKRCLGNALNDMLLFLVSPEVLRELDAMICAE